MSPKLTKKNRLDFTGSKLLLTFLCLILFTSFSPPGTRHFSVRCVVIDAGHGGHDPGCLGPKSKEKNIALGVSLKLGHLIEQNFPDVKVIYTRKTDQFIELYQRAAIANEAKADLFICIHCNSACYYDKKKRKDICAEETSGVETWVMGLHKSEANLEVSKRENSVVLLEKDYLKQYDGFDPNSPEANIIFSLYQNTYLDESLRMASYVQQEIKTRGHATRGVKQAGFLVLYMTAMPSVLVETGFLSNPDEEKFLLSERGQQDIAHSVFNAFQSYKNSVDFNDGKKESKGEADTAKEISADNTKSASQDSKTDSDKSNTPPLNKEVIQQKNRKPDPKPVSIAKKDEITFGVQFLTSTVKLPTASKKFNGVKNVHEEIDNGIFKYTSGRLSSWNEALSSQEELRKNGFKDAFVVAYINGNRTSVKEARQKLINGK